MAFDLDALPVALTAFTTERHLATLTTLRPDGAPHVTPVGYTWDADARLVRVITFAGARKARNLSAGGPGARAVVCQVDGGRWVAFEGPTAVTDEPGHVAEAVRRYAARYRWPAERPDRVALEMAVDRVTGRL
ncbi:MAG TPA: TIGR03618 family F420-dependent PPOX class oxidoreductase [Acidimicrobiales bacterium]|nr:TIGR03618 family F420-dependent PPOX class oxidoreductase [Acidimicrobiales bacterium]